VLRRFSRSVRALLAIAAIAGALASQPAFAADDAAQSWHYDLWNSLMSPYCPGRSLLDCTSSQAAELREWIAEQEKAGRPREDVEAQLYTQFGDVILQAPKASGFGLAAYVIPVVGVVVGALVLVIFLRRQAASAQSAPTAAAAPPDPELDRRIDEEMQRR
jgi:cytochrome c-type biogenesis protein CcmH